MQSVRSIRKNVRSLARRALVARAMILIYHRVTPLDFDPEWLAVTPDRFGEQMDVLRRHYHVLSLSELHACVEKGNVPRKAVALTFDDGYADNLLSARPVLERYDVPATVFVTTGKLEQKSEFWWDELGSLLLETPKLPDILSLEVNGRHYSWSLCDEGDASALVPDTESRNWNAIARDASDAAPEGLPRVGRDRTTPRRRHAGIGDVAACQWAGTDRKVRDTHRALRPEEVVSLNAGGLVEIGAHTVTHPVLSAHAPDAQEREIRLSKRRLEDILARPVGLFAYPFGERADYTPETVEIVREAGFSCACSNFEGWVRRGTSEHELPRYVARDWNGEEFARELAAWYAD